MPCALRTTSIGLLTQIVKPSYESYFLWLELTLTFVIPITMLSFKKSDSRHNCCIYLHLDCAGFITNRLNVSLIA